MQEYEREREREREREINSGNYQESRVHTIQLYTPFASHRILFCACARHIVILNYRLTRQHLAAN